MGFRRNAYAARVTSDADPNRRGPGGRIDPTLPEAGRRITPPSGGWGNVDPRRRAASTAPPAWRDRRHWRIAVAVAIPLLAAVVLFRSQLADLFWPDTRLHQLLQAGERALAEGRLTDADGSGAREYFEAARALDSDRGEAIDGLARVGRAALAEAQAALAAERPEEARRALALARALQVPRAKADAIDAELRRRQTAQAGIDELLARAEAARRAGRLVDEPQAEAGREVGPEPAPSTTEPVPPGAPPDAALPLYQRILALQPNLTAALQGREDALSDLLDRAAADMARGDMAAAAAAIATARRYDGGHVGLPDAQSALAREIERSTIRADADLRRGRLEAALDGYRRVQEAAPDQEDARRGIEAVAAAHAAHAGRLAADFRFDAAAAALGTARELAPQSPAVEAAEQRLERARQAQARLGAPVSPQERRRRVAELLSAVGQAEARGDWLTPPGDSAYDKLRAAQALAPDDAAVKQAAARLVPAVRECFERELRGNRVRAAQDCLDAWEAIAPGATGLRPARRQLALRWVAVGDERLGRGDVAFARHALEAARTLDVAAPGLEDFADRVHSAAPSPR